MKRELLIVLAVALGICLPAASQETPLTAVQEQAQRVLLQKMPELNIAWSSVLGTPRQVTGITSDRLRLEPEALKSYFAANFKDLFRIQDPGRELLPGAVTTDARGFSRLSLYQMYREVPVYGTALKLTLDPQQRLRTVSGKWLPDIELDTAPSLDQEQVMERILAHLRQAYAGPEPLPEDLRLEPDRIRLVVFDPRIYTDSPGVPHLAYHVVVQLRVFFVDAHTGEILYTYSDLKTVRDRETYNSASCLTLPGTLILNEAGPVGGAPDAETLSCHDFVAQTYDYFWNTHGRDGHTGSGDTMISTVHSGVPVIFCCLFGLPCCCSQANAAYLYPLADQWAYGDGGDLGDGRSFEPLSNALDVVAHEITHGVTQYSIFDSGGDPVGLDYTEQSGALNESYSDFFGAMVDRSDWLMGEDVTVGAACGALRSMADPPACGQPDHMDDYVPGGDVHDNSGIPNKVAYLISEGGVHPHSGIAVAGMGREATEALLYHTLTNYLTQTATFLEARGATLLAWNDLFPGDTAKYATICNAFVACGICDPTVPGHCDPCSPIEARDPVDIVLALDYSNSMNSPAEPGGSDKIDVLKDAAEMFLRTWEIFAMPGDRADVVFFDSDVNPLAVALQPFDADALVTEIRGRSARGYTAMGGAAQVALTGLASGASHPAILLFTNGMQNVNPMAVKIGDHYEIVNDAGAWGGTSSVPPNPGVAVGSYGIPIHIIGIGEAAATSYHTLLDELRAETGGLLHLTTSPDTDLRRFYLEQLVAALNLGTLEMVDYRYGTASPAASETFAVDGSVTRAAFVVHWPKGSPPAIQIYAPGGAPVTPTRWVPEDPAEASYYRIAVFDFPFFANGRRIGPAGDWRVAISAPGTSTVPYQATLLVDETEIHYDFGLPEWTLWTGDPITVTAQVTVSGQPVPLASATAEVRYPRTALGTFLATDGALQRKRARPPAAPSPPLTDLLPTPTQAKLVELLKDPRLRALLEPRARTLELSSSGGGGAYRAVLDEARLPGLYRFEISVAGSTPSGEPVARTQTLSAIVRVKPDRDATETVGEWIRQRSDGSGTVLITVIPFDEFGSFLGPGYADAFTQSATLGTFEGAITDALDGSYELRLEVPDRSQDPMLEIAIFGFEVYRGPLSKILRPAERFGFSAHVGLAYPDGVLDRFFDEDLAVALDFELVLKPRLSIEVLLGHDSFDGPGSDASFDHLSGNVKVFTSSRRVRGFFNGGAGAYKAEGDSSIFLGLNAGGGVSWQFLPRVYLESSYNYHLVFSNGDDSKFSTVTTGLKWRF